MKENASTKLGPFSLRLVAYKCYEKSFVQYKAAAGFPDYSLYVPRAVLPNDMYPYQIELTFESVAHTHWKRFEPDKFV